ncbi:hypothetical protein GUITHDRAFT_106722 [Guillardia theta CCMP2712]|uniref:Uncharacterized protein n=1 Tax=Guillardia theta (strain CCMP2712) TaxID=905079 RepID=L1JG47_GUITC|nr:hypothetical protein GUITHDRAFT_106722 [Guillardia theta CCMP2712]EKX47272.1 hypothetical protein GUITHDRAFT_106722 [Guillardia theta CCMP2712]|eukprot:XP_005834252.1 hypothetical protein GUITHDRAFT_106722 [Guillardia theta CCMP2712]
MTRNADSSPRVPLSLYSPGKVNILRHGEDTKGFIASSKQMSSKGTAQSIESKKRRISQQQLADEELMRRRRAAMKRQVSSFVRRSDDACVEQRSKQKMRY